MKTFRILVTVICLLLSVQASAQYWATPTDHDYSGMAKEITAGAETRYEQAEMIYRWICENIEYDVEQMNYSADETRINGKGVCQGYCELFFRLGEAIGLESKIIPGFSKNIKNTISIDRHSWIIATTEKGDIFIDPTWGAGIVIDKVFHKSESDMSWFDVDPYIMATSHMPIESRFLLLDREIDDKTFRKIPHIHSCLEKLGLDAEKCFEKALTGSLSLPTIYGTIGEKMGFMQIPFEGVLEYGSKYHIEYKENDIYDLVIRMDDDEIPSHAWNTENGITKVDFMVTAFNEVRILVMHKGKNAGEAAGGFGYKIHIPEVIPEEAMAAMLEYDPYLAPELKNIVHLDAKWYKKFGIDGNVLLDTLRITGAKAVPELFYDMEKLELVNVPLSSPLSAGKEYIFHFKSDPKNKWAIVNNSTFYDNWEAKPKKNGEFIYKFKIPSPGTLAIAIYIGGSKFQHAITWTVIEWNNQEETTKESSEL